MTENQLLQSVPELDGIHTYTHTHILTYTHTHILIYSHTHISTYTHIHIHVHIHTHTHIYTYRFKLKQTMRYLTFAFAIQGARFEAQAEAHGSKNDISHFWSRSRVKHKIIFIHCTYFLYIAS